MAEISINICNKCGAPKLFNNFEPTIAVKKKKKMLSLFKNLQNRF